jgi:hypothetical protein
MQCTYVCLMRWFEAVMRVGVDLGRGAWELRGGLSLAKETGRHHMCWSMLHAACDVAIGSEEGERTYAAGKSGSC